LSGVTTIAPSTAYRREVLVVDLPDLIVDRSVQTAWRASWVSSAFQRWVEVPATSRVTVVVTLPWEVSRYPVAVKEWAPVVVKVWSL
jgi:hypothetical protein